MRNRGVSAGDVEADACDAHPVAVRGHAADGHDVAEVAVCHERGVVGALGDAGELGQRLFLVLPEYLHGDGSSRADGPQAPASPVPGRTRIIRLRAPLSLVHPPDPEMPG